jgi:hypothetical protein
VQARRKHRLLPIWGYSQRRGLSKAAIPICITLLGMSLPRLPFPVLVVWAFTVFRSSPAACSAVNEQTPFSTPNTACHGSQGCASPPQTSRVWDIPMPSLHEKLYGAYHEDRLPPGTHNGSSAPLSFAYITASSWPRLGGDVG